jgi:adenylate kinase family enzyme
MRGVEFMIEPHGIIIFGANGSGKTTLGRELARVLDFKHIDIEDYCFEESEIPYAKPRSRKAYLNLMLTDVEKYGSFVATTVIGDLGDIIPKYYKLAVYLSAPFDLRMERVKQRSYKQYGERILQGGDMYEQELKFFDFVASRPLSKIDKWAETLSCPVIRVDGSEDWHINAVNIAKQFRDITGH